MELARSPTHLQDCARHPLFSDLSALSDADLAQRCKSSGLSREGGRESQLARLVYLRRHLDGEVDTADERAAVEVAARDQEVRGGAGETQGFAPFSCHKASRKVISWRLRCLVCCQCLSICAG